jgi:hypothetical protein
MPTVKKISDEQVKQLQEKLPDWAIKPHPTRPRMSAIHPMAVIDRLNEVFGHGGWNFETDFLSCDEGVQVTKKGTDQESSRKIYVSAVKGRMTIGDIVIEQFGGSTNDDKGDALKGGATDALTKIASYLGVGASIYKNQGNVDGGSEGDDDGFLPPVPPTTPPRR